MNKYKYEFELKKSLSKTGHPYCAMVWEHTSALGFDDLVGLQLFDTAADGNAWLHEQARFLGINNTFEINRTLGY